MPYKFCGKVTELITLTNTFLLLTKLILIKFFNLTNQNVTLLNATFTQAFVTATSNIRLI